MKNVKLALDKLLNLRRDIASRTILVTDSYGIMRSHNESNVLREIDEVRAILANHIKETERPTETHMVIESDPMFQCEHMKDMLVERCLVCENEKAINTVRSAPTTKPSGRYVVTNPKV